MDEIGVPSGVRVWVCKKLRSILFRQFVSMVLAVPFGLGGTQIGNSAIGGWGGEGESVLQG